MDSFRIIAGKLKNRRISIAGIEGVRPIAERRREALFNILGSLTGHVFADLCAGSGIVGFEAISRNAAFVHFVEHNQGNAAIIRGNLDKLKIDNARVCAVDVRDCFRCFPAHQHPSIIYFSPPYAETGLYQEFLQLLDRETLPNRAIIIIDRPDKLELTREFKTLVFDETRKYSLAALDFYYKQPA